ncbi:extracellular solute-binding protein [Paenibacillus sp. PL2-23]|uniref:extracellular solute-binding protein n=1 Tax=Paenibacillus sp. PL2-23 TaxID=2100729 RepID=UPI0030F6A56C
MHKKKWLGVFTVIVMTTVLALAGCSSNNAENNIGNKNSTESGEVGSNEQSNFNKEGYPIVKEKVTFQLVGPKQEGIAKEYNDMIMFKQLEEETNVHIEWSMTENSTWNEKKNLLFAGNDLPDAFYGGSALTTNEVVQYGSQGILIPLEELIEEYAPNLKRVFEQRPHYKEAITAPDGHIYSLPNIVENDSFLNSDTIYINKEWLDQVGMKVPETTDEFYQVLKAFKENDPNGNGKSDEIPLSFDYLHVNHGMYSLSGSFGVLDNPGTHTYLENEKVIFAPVQPGYREFLEYFHKLYREGLIDQEVFTQDEQVYFAKIKNKELGVKIIWNNVINFGDITQSPYSAIPPLAGPDGTRLWNVNRGQGINSFASFAITSEAERPEILMRWIDRQYEPDMSWQMHSGPFGHNLILSDNGKYDRANSPEGLSNNQFRHSEAPGNFGVWAVLGESNRLNMPAGMKEKHEAAQVYKPYLAKQENLYPDIIYNVEDVSRLKVLKTDIHQYIETAVPQFIIDGVTDSNWDTYINSLNKMGLQELIDIYQENYDNLD